VIFQPYATLPLLVSLLKSNSRGCVVGVPENVATLLKSTMKTGANGPNGEFTLASFFSATGLMSPGPPTRSGAAASKNSNAMVDVDAIVNLSDGKVTFAAGVEKLVALTLREKQFVYDLYAAAFGRGKSKKKKNEQHAGVPATPRVDGDDVDDDDSVSESIQYVGSDDYIRNRLREYLVNFLCSTLAIPGVQPLLATASLTADKVAFDPDVLEASILTEFHMPFVKHWLEYSKSARTWARRVSTSAAGSRGPPPPENQDCYEALNPAQLAVFAAERISQRFSSIVHESEQFMPSIKDVSSASNHALLSVKNLFKNIEEELSSFDVAMLRAASSSPRTSARQAFREMNSSIASAESAASKIAKASFDGDITSAGTPREVMKKGTAKPLSGPAVNTTPTPMAPQESSGSTAPASRDMLTTPAHKNLQEGGGSTASVAPKDKALVTEDEANAIEEKPNSTAS